MVRLELTYRNWSSKYWIWDLIAVGVMSFSAQCPPGVPIQLSCSPRTSLTTPVLPPAKVVRQLQLRAASARGRRLSTEVLWTPWSTTCSSTLAGRRTGWWTSAGGKHHLHLSPSRGYEKGQSLLYFLPRLWSSIGCSPMLRMFNQSRVASALLFFIMCRVRTEVNGCQQNQ